MSTIQLLEIIVLLTHEDNKMPSEPTALLLQVRDQEQEFWRSLAIVTRTRHQALGPSSTTTKAARSGGPLE